jgi:hypothetical protein
MKPRRRLRREGRDRENEGQGFEAERPSAGTGFAADGFDGENNLGDPLSTEWPNVTADRIEHDLHGTRDDYQGAPGRIHLRDRKGGDPSEWPDDLRVRELPPSP